MVTGVDDPAGIPGKCRRIAGNVDDPVWFDSEHATQNDVAQSNPRRVHHDNFGSRIIAELSGDPTLTVLF